MKKPELTQRQLLDIAHEHEVNVPISAYRVVGDRVELFLYGGGRISHSSAGRIALADLDTKQLRYLATHLNIPGRTKMKRAELLTALATADPDQLAVEIDLLLNPDHS